MLPIICFSGSIGSGKSSVSKVVAQRLGCKRAGFGDYVRHLVSKAGGDPTSRQELQDLGQLWVEADASAFCDGLLEFVGFEAPEPLIVDGIRHGKVFSLLKQKLHSQQVVLFHLEVDHGTRRSRFGARDGSLDGLESALAHVVEQESEEYLPTIADRLIDTNQRFEQVVEATLEAIKQEIDASGGL